jgi:hypothetical protein
LLGARLTMGAMPRNARPVFSQREGQMPAFLQARGASSRWILVFVIFGLAALALAGAAASADASEGGTAQALTCGQTVTTSVSLTTDLLNCTGHGLVIGARSASGSVCSPSSVEPLRSQNRTVTVLRTSREDDGVPRVAPQLLQKAAPSGLSRPQLLQMSTA